MLRTPSAPCSLINQCELYSWMNADTPSAFEGDGGEITSFDCSHTLIHLRHEARTQHTTQQIASNTTRDILVTFNTGTRTRTRSAFSYLLSTSFGLNVLFLNHNGEIARI